MPKLNRDTTEKRLADAERELWKLMDFRDMPMRQGAARPSGECPRGHEYPPDPDRYPPGTSDAGNRRCETCYGQSLQRKKLRGKIANYKRILRDLPW